VPWLTHTHTHTHKLLTGYTELLNVEDARERRSHNSDKWLKAFPHLDCYSAMDKHTTTDMGPEPECIVRSPPYFAI